jgi:oxygen-independent coproporphyrinogen-3 oxidase
LIAVNESASRGNSMPAFHPDLAARSVPRYTSYPTAADFTDHVGASDHVAALDGLCPDDTLSLYLHVPYCQEICWYCGCNTGPMGKTSRLDAYVEALIAEIALVASRCRGTVSRVHFGGGSPNALSTAQFDRIAEAIRGHFHGAHDAEWAVELDPRHLDAAFCDMLASNQVSRASLGAQTFDLGIQARINRLQPFRMVARCVDALRRAGIHQINLDLMYGLPGQTLDTIARTVALARTLAPDRVAMFGYAHLPRLLPRQRMIDERDLPGAEARFWQSILARDLWLEAGYGSIGFDHYGRSEDKLTIAARTGGLRRNFQGFTDDNATAVIGLGPSSISLFPDLIVQSEKHVGRYRMKALNGQLATAKGLMRSLDDRRRGLVIERLLCDGRADLTELGWSPTAAARVMGVAAPQLDMLEERGLIRRHDRGLTILPGGEPYARLAAVAFDRFRSTPSDRFSRAI